jgi:hypothetical protein
MSRRDMLGRRIHYMRKMASRCSDLASKSQEELSELTDIEQRFVTDDTTIRISVNRIDPKPNLEINYKLLRESVSDKVWLSITSCAVDQKKLETEIVRGNISQKVVSACIKYVPRKPYFRTEVASDDAILDAEQ